MRTTNPSETAFMEVHRHKCVFPNVHMCFRVAFSISNIGLLRMTEEASARLKMNNLEISRLLTNLKIV